MKAIKIPHVKGDVYDRENKRFGEITGVINEESEYTWRMVIVWEDTPHELFFLYPNNLIYTNHWTFYDRKLDGKEKLQLRLREK